MAAFGSCEVRHEDTMPKRAKEMSALDVKRATHPGQPDRNVWIAAGGVSGLLLQITPGQAKSWLLRTTIGGARRGVGLGPYPEVSLAEARERARQAKAKIAQGIDPVEERRAIRSALVAEKKRGMTFAEAWVKWMEAKDSQFKDEKARVAVRSIMARVVDPEIGKMRLIDVTPSDILRTLEPVWTTTPEQARKLRMRLEQVFAWASVAGHRPHDAPNPARWKHNLDHLLPPLETARKKVHQPGVAVSEIHGWWLELGKRDGIVAQALQFLTMCASRSGEVRGARWDEFDMQAGIWTIPGARMKMGRAHRVPLPASALDLLRAVPKLDGNPLVFPAPRGGELSDMAFSQLMRRMQAEAEKAAAAAGLPVDRAGWRDPESGRPAVPHGLRSTFRNWAAERGFDRDMSELALAHEVADTVERSYRRTDMLERRRQMMQAWVDFIEGKEDGGAVVVPFAAGGRI